MVSGRKIVEDLALSGGAHLAPLEDLGAYGVNMNRDNRSGSANYHDLDPGEGWLESGFFSSFFFLSFMFSLGAS